MKICKTMFSKALAYLMALAMIACVIPVASVSAETVNSGFIVPTAAEKLASANTWPGTIDLTEVDNGLKFTSTLNQMNPDYNVGLRTKFNLYDLTLNFHGTINANYFSVRFNSIGYSNPEGGEWGPGGASCLRVFTLFDTYGVYYRTSTPGETRICDGAPPREGLVDKDWSYRFQMNSDGSLKLEYYISGTLCGEGNIPRVALEQMNIDPACVYISFGLESGDAVSADSSIIFTGYKMPKITKTPVMADFLSTANTWSGATPSIDVVETEEGVDYIPRGDGFTRAHRVGLRPKFNLNTLNLDFSGYTNANYFSVCLTSVPNSESEWPNQTDNDCIMIVSNPDVSQVYYGDPSFNLLCEGIPNRSVLANNNWGYHFSLNSDGSLHVRVIVGTVVAGEGNISKAYLDSHNIDPNNVYISFCLYSGGGNNISDGKITFKGYNDISQNLVTMDDMLRTCNDWASQNLTVANSNKGVAINANTSLDPTFFLEYNVGSKTKFSLRDLTLKFNNYFNNNYFSVRFHSGGYNENEGIAGGQSDLRIFMLHDLYDLYYRSYDASTGSTDESKICGGVPLREGLMGKDWSYHFSLNQDGSLAVQFLINNKVIDSGIIPKSALDAVGINPDDVYVSFGFESSEGGVPTTGSLYYTGYASSVEKTIETINAIGNVSRESKAVIEAARTLYNCVPASQKSQVTNYANLVAAETEFAKIPVIGDLDANGTVADANDLILMRKALLKTMDSSTTYEAVYDVNGDNAIDILDFIVLKNLALAAQ